MIITIITLVVYFNVINGRIVGTHNLSKIYRKNSIKGKGWGLNINFFNNDSDKNKNQDTFYALNNISLTLDDGAVYSIVGPSGSGKSTLAKCLVGKEKYDYGEIHNNGKIIVSAYLDHLFSQTYDESLTINQSFQLLNKYSKDYENISSYKDLMSIIELPLNEQISNLLESQRKIFELFYAILQSEIAQLTAISNNKNSINSYIVILDEYIDKDVASVRSNFFRVLKLLSNHSKFQLQVIIITHSKAVFHNFSDKVIVLNNGKLYFQGNPKNAFLPNQLQMLD